MNKKLVAALLALSACTHQPTQAPPAPAASAPVASREPALWTQSNMSAAELFRTHITCKNADKLVGAHSGVLSADANFGFGSDGAPTNLSMTLEMRNRGPISKNLGCSGGSTQGESESFVITCGSDSSGAGWVFSLSQSESIYAKQNSLAFFKGSLAMPASAFTAGSSGSDSIEVNCLARAGSHTAADEHYLSELRHMFGHHEHE